MSALHGDDNGLSLRISVAKDRLSRLLEAAANGGDPGQVKDLIDEEEAEITRLEIARDEAEEIGERNGNHRHQSLAPPDNQP